jgi:hypothetical protein
MFEHQDHHHYLFHQISTLLTLTHSVMVCVCLVGRGIRVEGELNILLW